MKGTGKICRVNVPRYFGFIRPDEKDGSRDYFFHGSDLNDLELNESAVGVRVTFTRGTSAKGHTALNIFALRDEPAAGLVKGPGIENESTP
jgi:cold shock CspA family protein